MELKFFCVHPTVLTKQLAFPLFTPYINKKFKIIFLFIIWNFYTCVWYILIIMNPLSSLAALETLFLQHITLLNSGLPFHRVVFFQYQA